MIRKYLKEWLYAQNALSVLFCLCMIAGLMWSRALLSIATILFFANSLHPATFLRNWKSWKGDFFSVACFLYFLLYALSGFWSVDLHQWMNTVSNKLQFAVLPFAFFMLPLKEKKWQRVIVFFLIAIHLIVVFYSIGALVAHFNYYINSYSISHSLPTTKYNDHIRFSLSLVATLVIIFYYFFENKSVFAKVSERWFLIISGIIFIIYLHILASKTGIVALYLFLFVFAIYFFRKKKKLKKYTLPFLIVLAALPVALYFFVPTFQEKAIYVRKEWQIVVSKDTLNYNYSDAGRIISYKMAAKVWEKHKWIGTGAGDLMHEMDTAYQINFPKIPVKNHLIPHDQYFYDVTTLGMLLGGIIFILCIASFWWFPTPVFYGRITSVIMMFAMLAEAMLEIQFGIFVFLFFLLFWKNMPKKVSR